MTATAKIYIDRGDAEDIRVAIEADYSPERPAPFCQNPSDPRYSDSGDPEEIEITSCTVAEDNGIYKTGDAIGLRGHAEVTKAKDAIREAANQEHDHE